VSCECCVGVSLLNIPYPLWPLRLRARDCYQRLHLTRADRLLWVWVSRLWKDWRRALVIVKPDTVIAWHRKGFRLLWMWKSRRGIGRPPVSPDVRALIRTMSNANPEMSENMIRRV
jgi:hypothetical protein